MHIEFLIEEVSAEAARDIATHMQPERNHSQSFHAFRQGLLSLIEHQ